MAAAFNQLDFVHKLEREGLARGAAEAIASGIGARSDLVTRSDLKAELDGLRAEMRSAIELSASQVTVRLGAIVGGVGALVMAVLGTLIALK